MKDRQTVLVVAPHADDEVLGCGGVIARYTRQGDEVHVLILGKAAQRLYDEAAREAPLREARVAHGILGVASSQFKDFPAPLMDTVAIQEIADAIRKVIYDVRPDTLFVPHRGDIHQDHGVVFQAALIAARPLSDCPVRRILVYETLSETEWAPPFGNDYFIPNVFVDIGETLPVKLRAMEAYKSQLRQPPHPRSTWGLKSLAQFRGSTVACHAAEAFVLIREVM